MNDIGEMIAAEIERREKQIEVVEVALADDKEFVGRLRQALAVINGESATSKPIPTRSQAAKHSASTAAASRKELDKQCGCGRPSNHKGRCSFRRGVKQQNTAPAPQPLRAKNSSHVGGSNDTITMPSVCPKCGGPKGRSPYANCRSCMGPQSVKAERDTRPSAEV